MESRGATVLPSAGLGPQQLLPASLAQLRPRRALCLPRPELSFLHATTHEPSEDEGPTSPDSACDYDIRPSFAARPSAPPPSPPKAVLPVYEAPNAPSNLDASPPARRSGRLSAKLELPRIVVPSALSDCEGGSSCASSPGSPGCPYDALARAGFAAGDAASFSPGYGEAVKVGPLREALPYVAFSASSILPRAEPDEKGVAFPTSLSESAAALPQNPHLRDVGRSHRIPLVQQSPNQTVLEALKVDQNSASGPSKTRTERSSSDSSAEVLDAAPPARMHVAQGPSTEGAGALGASSGRAQSSGLAHLRAVSERLAVAMTQAAEQGGAVAGPVLRSSSQRRSSRGRAAAQDKALSWSSTPDALVHDMEMRALEGKLELLRLQRQLSEIKCRSFLDELAMRSPPVPARALEAPPFFPSTPQLRTQSPLRSQPPAPTPLVRPFSSSRVSCPRDNLLACTVPRAPKSAEMPLLSARREHAEQTWRALPQGVLAGAKAGGTTQAASAPIKAVRSRSVENSKLSCPSSPRRAGFSGSFESSRGKASLPPPSPPQEASIEKAVGSYELGWGSAGTWGDESATSAKPRRKPRSAPSWRKHGRSLSMALEE